MQILIEIWNAVSVIFIFIGIYAIIGIPYFVIYFAIYGIRNLIWYIQDKREES